jgi:hypothetical protein
MIIDHEQQLILAFFVPARRDHYVGMIATTRRRQKFLRELSHFKSLDPQYCVGLPNAVRTPGQIAAFLNEKGAPPTCWVTSEDRDLDRQELPLLETLKTIMGYRIGTFLSCIPGRLAYFEGEEIRWILERHDGQPTPDREPEPAARSQKPRARN